MKKIIFSLLAFFGVLSAEAQVPKTIVVEHFTNTRCGICANRNPGFFSNLDNHDGVLHMAVHPSSPYSSCVLNQHNSSENDDRTRFYGVYGSTPRLVIQGDVISVSTNYGSASIFNAYEDDSTAFSLVMEPAIASDEDSLYMTVHIIKESTSDLTTADLFVAAAEKLVMYDAPNGEVEHHNVFRKSYFDTEGMSINLPAMVGDTATFMAGIEINSEWELDEMFGMAILQDNQEVLQAASSYGIELDVIGADDDSDDSDGSEGTDDGSDDTDDSDDITGISEIDNFQLKVYPNPTSGALNLVASDAINRVSVYNLVGQLVEESNANSNNVQLNLSHLPSGQYIVKTLGAQEQLNISRFSKR